MKFICCEHVEIRRRSKPSITIYIFRRESLHYISLNISRSIWQANPNLVAASFISTTFQLDNADAISQNFLRFPVLRPKQCYGKKDRRQINHSVTGHSNRRYQLLEIVHVTIYSHARRTVSCQGYSDYITANEKQINRLIK